MDRVKLHKRRIIFFSGRRRHTRSGYDWSSNVCSSDLNHASSALIDSRAHLLFVLCSDRCFVCAGQAQKKYKYRNDLLVDKPEANYQALMNECDKQNERGRISVVE